MSSRLRLPKVCLLNWKQVRFPECSWKQLGNLLLDKTLELEERNIDISMEFNWLMHWNIDQGLSPHLYLCLVYFSAQQRQKSWRVGWEVRGPPFISSSDLLPLVLYYRTLPWERYFITQLNYSMGFSDKGVVPAPHTASVCCPSLRDKKPKWVSSGNSMCRRLN